MGLPENDENKSEYNGISPERIAGYQESLDGDKVLGLYDIVDERETADHRRERASCTYQPAPSVIMTNQIIAAFMVDRFRMILDGRKVSNIFYDSRYPWELKTA